MLRSRLVLILVIIVLAGIVGCGADKDLAPSVLQSPVLEPLISEELLAEAGLEMVWQREMPMKVGEKLASLYVVGDVVYGVSSLNYLVSINRENGKVMFSRGIGGAGLPILGLKHFDDEVYSVVGNRLLQMDLGFGEDRGEKSFDFGVVCPPVRNSRYFYIGGSDRRVHAYNSETKVLVFEAAAMSDSLVTDIVAGEDFVVFSTVAGDVLCIAPHRPRQLWEEAFKAEAAIVGPMVRVGRQLIFASMDTNVYSVDLYSGRLDWKYPSGAVLKVGPVVTRVVVYQYVEERGLAAIERLTGRFKWQLADGFNLLSESDGRAYVVTRTGRLVVMDNIKNEELYSVNLLGVSKYASNVNDSKMYVADERGRIACLQPAEK